jgi:DNA primase
MMPAGEDPDTFIRRQGGAAYQEKLRSSRPYLDYLLDRTALEHDFSSADSRREFLGRMLSVAARIPDAAARDQFADRLAHKARITEEVVRAEIRKAAVQKQTVVDPRRLAPLGQVKPAEKGLIWALIHTPATGADALAELEPQDIEQLPTKGILDQARSLQGLPAASLPETLIERLNSGEAALVQEIGRQPQPPADPADCARALKRLRYDRERADVQRQIDRLQEEGAARHEDAIVSLWDRKKTLLRKIETLMDGGHAVVD